MVDGIVGYGDNSAMELVMGKEEDHMTMWDYTFINPFQDWIDLGFLDADSPESTTTTSSSPAAAFAAEEAVVTPSDLGAPFTIDEIEEILFNDSDHNNSCAAAVPASDEFFSDLLLNSPLQSSTTTTATVSDNEDKNLSSSPDIMSLQQHRSPSPPPPLSDLSQLPQPEVPLKDSPPPLHEGSQLGSPGQPEEGNEDEEQDADDPISKKRKRLIRNRDAAVRSRERKKMYVKDLEMKSRFYESECRRLGMLLQCYVAENHALRLSLHSSNSGQAFGASSTRQESAVLLLESLLLGSLLWFLGVISLLIVSQQLLSEAAPMENVGNKSRQRSLLPREARSDVLFDPSFMMSKRCRGSRRKMRCSFDVAALVTLLRDSKAMSFIF